MNKFVKGAVVAGLALSIGGTGFLATATQVHANSAQLVDNTAKINALIQEKQEAINKKKVSRDWQEQKALGIRIGEIEREIQALKKGSTTSSSTGNTTTPAEDTAAKINALIKEKQEVINKKKVSRDPQEQKALGIRIGEIEREIQALKNGSATGGSTENTVPSTPVEDNAAKINALIKEKQELINKKKVSRDKNEQKALGKQIDQIEKQIKQLKKNK
ncbi:hypothetical protein UAW_01714 [Enterococcus haemoperoxidus ATCC BAA-382]|uniref:Uncharacterized protein n=1 Tax=Enterococcus haemoperoxidus ATCC BAA-382 TaxID=1158608 RepID=R2SVC6_9ENTE|nr:hypothetical protein [Enterococcus haemoperoxidus]EOH96756.1 hypothetical protein UAW_01714 [Enterococcus haemoperoxidus ATCC BAA-382]EOT60045.1 hypothetical protein I583_02680 [Enterococcus haemoperoxidus ATCC BAA-382]OJG56225.1 hypothetical protein RV06_GL000341 [Enterococcus haemoperoxidus]